MSDTLVSVVKKKKKTEKGKLIDVTLIRSALFAAQLDPGVHAMLR